MSSAWWNAEGIEKTNHPLSTLHHLTRFKTITQKQFVNTIAQGGSSLLGNADHKRSATNASRLTRSVIFVAVFLLLATSLSPAAWHWHRAWLTRQLAARVSQSAEDQVEVPIRQLARMGLPAIEPLVAIAASERAAPANAAQEVVSDLVAAWEIEAEGSAATSDLGIKLETLASALARHVDRLSPTGKRWAEGLALRILLHAEHVTPDRSIHVLANCQAVLASVPPRGPRLRNLQRTAQSAGTAKLPPLLAKPRTDIRQFAVTGQLADPSSITKRLPRLAGVPGAVDSNRFRSRLPAKRPLHNDPNSVSNSDPNRSHWTPEWGFGQPHNPVETGTRPNAPLTSRAIGPTTSRVLDVPTPDEMERHRQQLQSLTLRELIVQLSVTRDFKAAMVLAVARQRGLSDAEIAMATMLASSEPSRRLQLLDGLTKLPAASARRWLRWLLDDVDGEVRFRALTMMATTGDPQLFDLARRRAVEDADERVVKLAAQIMQSQKKR